MEISVLGPVRIHRDGEEISLGPRLRRLLAALVIERGRVVSADALEEMVWDGDPPTEAHNTLRTYVTRLRQALGVDASEIEFRHTGYVLDADACEIDADGFEADVTGARIALQLADVRSAEASIERALGRWYGEPFGEIEDETWVRPERVRLEERRTEARELYVEVMLAGGRAEEAIASARALIEGHAVRERPRELLMRAMYVAGRQAEAVREFRAYRELLAEETGLDPSESLVELESRILTGELSRRAPAGRVRGYELGEVLGRGAFSVVHRATQPGIGRDVAVKIIRAELADRPDFIRRFEREAQLAAAVEHPHVVPLYDFWREPGSAHLVMRWMRGGDLSSALRGRGPLSREQLCRVLDEVGGALHAAHRAGVLHRDVRPANLLRDEDGATYLADFGIAVGSTIGLSDATVHYAAPEMLRGESLDAAADVHSLGVSTFELLTGRLPLSDTTDRAELVRRQLSEALPSVRATRSDLPSQIDDVLAHATSKVASERYATVPEFVDDVARVLGGSGRPATYLTPAPNPYVGLHAFTEADAGRFHGRDQLIGELADAVERHRLVVVVGPSGSGKSSVVRAGLIPAIRRSAVPGSESWFVTTMVPGADPIAALESALLRVAVNPPASLRDQLAEDGGLLRAVRRVLPDTGTTVLVVIDQFEELFTVVGSDELRRRFLRELAHAISAPASPLRVVATLRADHYDAPLRDAALAQLVTDGTVTVRPMRPDELEAAITNPANAVGVGVESALVADMVAGVSDRPAALPLLQFALTELYERRVADVMLLETHQSLGGLSGALAARAERIVGRGDDHDEQLIRRIFTRLIAFGDSTDGDARRRAPLAELGDDERTVWLIDEFVTARLLVVDRDDETRAPTVEVAHEALLRDWPRLTDWIDEDRADLRSRRMITAAASEWADAGGDAGLLARGGRLELVSELADRRPELLNDTEREWIDRSKARAAAEAERDRRQRQRTRRALVATAVLLVVAVAVGSVALVLRNRAADNERVAEARELVLEAEQAIAEDPELGLLLGLAAVAAFDDATGEIPTRALQNLRSGIKEQHVRARFPGGGWVAAIPERGAIATAGTDVDGDGVPDGIAVGDIETGTITDEITLDGWTVFDGRWTGEHLLVAAHESNLTREEAEWYAMFRVDVGTGTFDRFGPDIPSGSWSRAGLDESVAVTRPTPGTVEIERAADRETRSFAMAPSAPDVSHTDGMLAFPFGTDEASGVAVVDVTTWDRTDIVVEDFVPQRAVVSPDGNRVAVTRQAGDVAVYDRRSGAPVWDETLRLERSGVPVWAPDGSDLVIGYEDGLVVVDAVSGSVSDVLDVHDGGTWAFEFVGDTGMIATAGIADGATLVVDPRDGPEVGVGPASAPFEPFFIASTPTGHVVAFDGKDYAVIDVGSDEVVGGAQGIFDVFTDYGFTMPIVDISGRFISVNDGVSQLRNVDDDETVWRAPSGWTIRGASSTGERVVISREDEAAGTWATKLVTLSDTGAGLSMIDEVELAGAGPSIGQAVFSPDGELVIVVPLAADWKSKLFRSDGTELHRFAEDAVRWTFTADGTRIFAGLITGDVVGLDVARLVGGATADDAEIFRVAAHQGNTIAYQMSADGRSIASDARGEPLRVWDVESGALRAEFDTGDASERSITFHPSEPWVYVSQGEVITVHTLDTDELIDAAESHVTRELTEEECQRFLRRSCG